MYEGINIYIEPMNQGGSFFGNIKEYYVFWQVKDFLINPFFATLRQHIFLRERYTNTMF